MASRCCNYNIGVDCDTTDMNCTKCGWNPKVKKVRVAKLRGIEPNELARKEGQPHET